jgi:hypothetical protein
MLVQPGCLWSDVEKCTAMFQIPPIACRHILLSVEKSIGNPSAI